MKNNILVLRVLWWTEVVFSARVLFFTIPVIITKYLNETFSPVVIDDWFILMLTVVSFLYLTVGAASLGGHRLWRQFHYLVTALIFLLTAGLFARMRTSGIAVQWEYFLPLMISIGITAVLVLRILTVPQEKKWQSILVIDDDETLIKTIRPVLIGEGFSVLTANSGEVGLEIAESQMPDLIILDVIMPGVKGREVCKKIKDNPKTKSIPVIFLTAKDSKDDINAELDAGGEKHLTKPFDKKELIAAIREILPAS